MFHKKCAQESPARGPWLPVRCVEKTTSGRLRLDRPLIITSSVGLGNRGPGEPAVEQVVDWDHPNPRKASEQAGAAALERGVSVAVVRLPQVHDAEKQGLLSPLIEIAREQAAAHFGWMAMFAALDMAASSDRTRAELGWAPSGPSLIADLTAMDYDRLVAAPRFSASHPG